MIQKLAECLVPHWEAIESTYIDTSKHVFNDIRTEREKIIRYFYSVRKDFLQYLQRPDSKQDFVDQWVAVSDVCFGLSSPRNQFLSCV